MPGLFKEIRSGTPIAHHRPWPRLMVDAGTFAAIGPALARGAGSLVSLWADGDVVHIAVMMAAHAEICVFTVPCAQGRFPSIGIAHPPARRLERATCDLFGLNADGAPDKRPWLDHGRWGLRHPLGAAESSEAIPPSYAFLAAEGESLHQIPVGPVHAGIIEPGHFRFTANGETVVRLEERLGYVHKGIDRLMTGATLEGAAKLAGCVSGDSTVAYAFAFAQAIEAALDVTAPPRVQYLRALMAELERIANHLGDIGAICNDASFALLQAHFAVLRERVLRAAQSCFGHRLMRDVIVPGGVAVDLDAGGRAALSELITAIRAHLPALVDLYDETASLQDRMVDTGILKPALADQFGAGGYVGRASGRAVDARRTPGYAPYDALSFEVPVLDAGDVNARVWIRIKEVEQSLSLVEQILQKLPEGAIRADLPAVGAAREGAALVESFRGDVFAWVRLDEAGRVARCHLRDPSWFQWPLLEAVIEGNIVADFPLCNKSFNCSYSGHDL